VLEDGSSASGSESLKSEQLQHPLGSHNVPLVALSHRRAKRPSLVLLGGTLWTTYRANPVYSVQLMYRSDGKKYQHVNDGAHCEARDNDGSTDHGGSLLALRKGGRRQPVTGGSSPKTISDQLPPPEGTIGLGLRCSRFFNRRCASYGLGPATWTHLKRW
jgi:hypothetical protein